MDTRDTFTRGYPYPRRARRGSAGAGIALAFILILALLAVPFLVLVVQHQREMSSITQFAAQVESIREKQGVKALYDTVTNTIELKNDGSTDVLITHMHVVADANGTTVVESIFLPEYNISWIITSISPEPSASGIFLKPGESANLTIRSGVKIERASFITSTGKIINLERKEQVVFSFPPGYAGSVIAIPFTNLSDLSKYADISPFYQGYLELFDQSTGSSWTTTYASRMLFYDTDRNGFNEIVYASLGPLIDTLGRVYVKPGTLRVTYSNFTRNYIIEFEVASTKRVRVNDYYGGYTYLHAGDKVRILGFVPDSHVGGYLEVGENYVEMRGICGIVEINGEFTNTQFYSYSINELRIGSVSIQPLRIVFNKVPVSNASLIVVHYRIWYLDDLDDYNSIDFTNVWNAWLVRVGLIDAETGDVVAFKEYRFQDLMTMEETGPPGSYSWIVDSAGFPTQKNKSYYVFVEIQDPFEMGKLGNGDWVPADMYIGFEFIALNYYG